jgi:hypothetical protein
MIARGTSRHDGTWRLGGARIFFRIEKNRTEKNLE